MDWCNGEDLIILVEEAGKWQEDLVELFGKFSEQALVDAFRGLFKASVAQIPDGIDNEGSLFKLGVNERFNIVDFIGDFYEIFLQQLNFTTEFLEFILQFCLLFLDFLKFFLSCFDSRPNVSVDLVNVTIYFNDGIVKIFCSLIEFCFSFFPFFFQFISLLFELLFWFFFLTLIDLRGNGFIIFIKFTLLFNYFGLMLL